MIIHSKTFNMQVMRLSRENISLLWVLNGGNLNFCICITQLVYGVKANLQTTCLQLEFKVRNTTYSVLVSLEKSHSEWQHSFVLLFH